MSHAERCPVCGGTGHNVPQTYIGMVNLYPICMTCGGAGWIVVPDGLDQNIKLLELFDRVTELEKFVGQMKKESEQK